MTLSGHNPLTADGVFTHDVIPGAEYACMLSGDFANGTLTIQYENPLSDGGLVSPLNNTFTGTDEFVIVPVTNRIRFTLSGSAGAELYILIAKRS